MRGDWSREERRGVRTELSWTEYQMVKLVRCSYGLKYIRTLTQYHITQ